jgi:hypothetical protein
LVFLGGVLGFETFFTRVLLAFFTVTSCNFFFA